MEDSPFWDIISRDLDITMPPYLKHLMSITGFDNPVSVRLMDAQDVQKMLMFARTEMKDLVPQGDMKIAFGIFHERPHKFQILPGHMHLLEAIKDHCTQKPLEYFKETRAEPPRKKRSHAETTEDTAAASVGPDEERCKVQQLITAWLMKYVPDCVGEELAVEIIASDTTDGQKLKLSAHVNCPICHGRTQVSQTSTKRDGKRWIISNFVRHVKSHFDPVFKGRNSSDSSNGELYSEQPNADEHPVQLTTEPDVLPKTEPEFNYTVRDQ